MKKLNHWPELLTKSSFFALKKEEELSADLKELQTRILSRILDSDAIHSYHPKRKNEFILGRVCASKAHEACVGQELLCLPRSPDRSPLWPPGILGSISHSQEWVGAVVSKHDDLLGVGIDFELMGRTKIELSSHIRSSKDLTSHPSLTNTELLTVIFSCKESLYKALYPVVKCFFGFHDAALRSIDLESGRFSIDLLSQLNADFGPSSHHSFEGRLAINGETCLTVLEIFSQW